MSKFKQKLQKQFKLKPEFSYQDWIQNWSTDQLETIKSSFSHLQDLYYAQKAVRKNASQALPFKTLVLLGQKLSHPAFEAEIQKMINENIIKFNDHFYKLDDSHNQNKVQKAIRTYQFHECQEIKKAA